MGCNSIMVDRLLLIPPFHLALLKHEGLPVTLIASMDANRNAEDLVGIDGFSNRVPWRRHRTMDEEFDPAPAQ